MSALILVDRQPDAGVNHRLNFLVNGLLYSRNRFFEVVRHDAEHVLFLERLTCDIFIRKLGQPQSRIEPVPQLLQNITTLLLPKTCITKHFLQDAMLA